MNSRVERAAERLLERFGLDEPPIPVDDLAEMLGARLVFEPLQGDVSGMLYRDGGPPVIGINSNHAETRRRFSIAHEIGHLRLHRGREMIVDHLYTPRIDFRDETARLAVDDDEIEANGFAAALLMPSALVFRAVRQELDRTTNDERILASLAKRFGVSKQAMSYRLMNLGIRLSH